MNCFFKRSILIMMSLMLCACQISKEKEVVTSICPPQIYEMPIFDKTIVELNESESFDLHVLNFDGGGSNLLAK